MIFSIRGEKVTIDDIYVSYSPYLSVLASTSIGKDKDGDIILLDEDPKIFHHYVLFLEGKLFSMNEDIEILFDKMGHTNNMGYSYDYWAIKLRDNWIRDNFYRLQLWKDPYYGLVPIPVRRSISMVTIARYDTQKSMPFTIPNGAYIAGGAALYMAGYIDKLNDIDVFFTGDKDAAETYIRNNTHDIRDTVSVMSVHVDNAHAVYDMQFIHRIYKSPAEIIYGFDLDCVGILYDGKSLWCTERCIYSLKNKINWFDPMRASPSYAYRLCKYKTRGFSIGLPFFNENMIHKERIDTLFTMLANKFVKKAQSDIGNYDMEPVRFVDKSHINKLSVILPYISVIFNYVSVELDTDDIGYMIGLFKHVECFNSIWGSIMHIVQFDIDWDVVPKDPVSMLILAEFHGICSSKWKSSDYDPKLRKSYLHGYKPSKKNNPDMYRRFGILSDNVTKEDVKSYVSFWSNNPIVWKEQNPMEQVTSTFCPTPIKDIKSWYKTSIFHKDYLPEKLIDFGTYTPTTNSVPQYFSDLETD